HGGADQFRHRHLVRIGNSETCPQHRRLLHRLHHRRVRVPKNRRPPRPHVIHIFVPVHVDHPRPARLPRKERLPAHRAERPHRRVHPSRDVPQRLREQLLRFNLRNHAQKLTPPSPKHTAFFPGAVLLPFREPRPAIANRPPHSFQPLPRRRHRQLPTLPTLLPT